jgi:hypothetical protein
VRREDLNLHVLAGTCTYPLSDSSALNLRITRRDSAVAPLRFSRVEPGGWRGGRRLAHERAEHLKAVALDRRSTRAVSWTSAVLNLVAPSRYAPAASSNPTDLPIFPFSMHRLILLLVVLSLPAATAMARASRSSPRSEHPVLRSERTRTTRCDTCQRDVAGRIRRSSTARRAFQHQYPLPVDRQYDRCMSRLRCRPRRSAQTRRRGLAGEYAMADDLGCKGKGSNRIRTRSHWVALTLVIIAILLPLWVVCRPEPPADHDTGAPCRLVHLRRAPDQPTELPGPGLERQEVREWH